MEKREAIQNYANAYKNGASRADKAIGGYSE